MNFNSLPTANYPTAGTTAFVSVTDKKNCTGNDCMSRMLIPQTAPGMGAPLDYSQYALLADTTWNPACNQSYSDETNPCALPYKNLVGARGGYVYGENPQKIDGTNKYDCTYLQASIPSECRKF